MDSVSRLEQLRALAKRYDEEGVGLLSSTSIGAEIHQGVKQLLSVELNPDRASEYLVEASDLLQQLGREVMPLDRDRGSRQVEEQEDADPDALLIERLMEYRRFRELAKQLHTRREEFLQTYPRGSFPERELAPELKALRGVELGELFEVFEELLEETAAESTPQFINRDEVTVARGIERINEVLRERGGETSFYSLFAGDSRLELVVTFLALLELMRQGTVTIHQSEQFSEIRVQLVQGGSGS